MARKTFVLFILVVFLIALNGCATTRKQKDLEIQGLRNQVSVLEAQLQSKDEEITSLRGSLTKSGEETQVRQASRKRIIAEVKSRPNVKQIQVALANAGYDPGAIDGKKGRMTREAIKAFQRANNLSADGKVGKQTWRLLKEYLYKKVK